MDIKEIALKVADSLRNKVDGISHMQSNQGLARFAEALIESYKAELLKEVGEPVAFLHQWIEYHPYGDTVAGEPFLEITNDGKPFDKSDTVTPLFAFDQVDSAILKATGPLEEEVERLFKSGEKLLEEKHKAHKSEREVWEQLNELRSQLAAAQEEISEWRGKHDVACLTITKLQKQYETQLAATSKAMGAEEELLIVKDQLAKVEQLWQVAQGRCDGLEEKLAKAEQRVAEWQPIETAPEEGAWALVHEDGAINCAFVKRGELPDDWTQPQCPNITPEQVTHWMPLPKAPNGASS